MDELAQKPGLIIDSRVSQCCSCWIICRIEECGENPNESNRGNKGHKITQASSGTVAGAQQEMTPFINEDVDPPGAHVKVGEPNAPNTDDQVGLNPDSFSFLISARPFSIPFDTCINCRVVVVVAFVVIVVVGSSYARRRTFRWWCGVVVVGGGGGGGGDLPPILQTDESSSLRIAGIPTLLGPKTVVVASPQRKPRGVYGDSKSQKRAPTDVETVSSTPQQQQPQSIHLKQQTQQTQKPIHETTTTTTTTACQQKQQPLSQAKTTARRDLRCSLRAR